MLVRPENRPNRQRSSPGSRTSRPPWPGCVHSPIAEDGEQATSVMFHRHACTTALLSARAPEPCIASATIPPILSVKAGRELFAATVQYRKELTFLFACCDVLGSSSSMPKVGEKRRARLQCNATLQVVVICLRAVRSTKLKWSMYAVCLSGLGQHCDDGGARFPLPASTLDSA